MNKEIKVMIELQRYWDNVLRGRNDIEKCEKSILYWKKQVEEKSKALARLDEKIKEIKVVIKQKELVLSEKDEQIKKINNKKDIIKNEKEMIAIDNEFKNIQLLKDNLENELIILFDSLSEEESELINQKSGLSEIEQQSVKDVSDIKEKINHSKDLIDENQKKFDETLIDLSPDIKTRFLKLIKSQNGKAIAMIERDNCGICNCQIPFNLIQDVSKDNKIINCTNCGRFIYIA